MQYCELSSSTQNVIQPLDILIDLSDLDSVTLSKINKKELDRLFLEITNICNPRDFLQNTRHDNIDHSLECHRITIAATISPIFTLQWH